MTLNEATGGAKRCASNYKNSMIVVKEGPHADEHAEFDADGESYGYCPESAKATLYPHGEVVAVIPKPYTEPQN